MLKLKRMQKLPLFPLLPFGPILLAGSVVALEAFILGRLRRLSRAVDKLAQSQPPFPSPA
jgi:hypothetical protein